MGFRFAGTAELDFSAGSALYGRHRQDLTHWKKEINDLLIAVQMRQDTKSIWKIKKQ